MGRSQQRDLLAPTAADELKGASEPLRSEVLLLGIAKSPALPHLLRLEDLLDPHPEQTGDAKRQRHGLGGHLGAGRRELLALMVPGVGWECIAEWVKMDDSVNSLLRTFGFDTREQRGGSARPAEHNSRVP